MSNDFYVYCHVDDNGTAYYVGAGSGDRASQRGQRRSEAWRCHTQQFCKSGFPKVVFYKENLTREESFKFEKKCIRKFGRMDLETGTLVNKTQGGKGSTGRIITEEFRNKTSVSAKSRPCLVSGWNRGLKTPKIIRNKLSKAHIGQNPWNKGIKTGHIPANRRSIRCNETNEIFTSVREAAEKLNLDRALISHVLSGARKHTGNYSFSYERNAE